MSITKNIITRAEAKKLALVYVKFIDGDLDALDKVLVAFDGLKRGQKVLTYIDGKYVLAKVSSMNSNCIQAIDGPVVRVSNDEGSWRVDGNKFAWPLE